MSEAIAMRVEQLPAQTETAAIISMIERTVRDVSIPIDRLEKMLELRDRIEGRNAERAFDAAMTAAQSEMRPVAKDSSNPQTRSKYASYNALDSALRPTYTHHGFSLSFNTGTATENEIEIICDVAHRDGHKRPYKIPMPRDGKGAKGNDVMTKTHATGSATTYGRRYLLQMIFNIVTGDDDGNAASGLTSRTDGTVSEEQVLRIQSLIVEVGADIPRFLKFFKVETVEDLPASQFATAVQMLNRKRS